MSEVRVRFPPSPTGYLHIGSARTAIYNWLFAQKYGGKLILRIEDTDTERSTNESTQGIISGLEWLGITWDEGPYFQSAYSDEHKAAAQQLITDGHAYKCFCSKEELDARREAAIQAKITYQYDRTCLKLSTDEIKTKEEAGIPYVIRFRIPDRDDALSFSDMVNGRIDKPYRDIEDFVIVRSNGAPLYLLCNVVDDIRDRITHIIRGKDGLDNTPRQILIYQALGAVVPQFAHMSFTLDPNKAKISKRTHGEVVTVQFYRDHGFLPWALINFLVLLGWSTSHDQEIFSKEELIEAFSLEGLNKTNSVFNYHKGDPKFFTDPKAISINEHYLRSMPVEDLCPLVKKDFQDAGLWQESYESEKEKWFLDTLDLIRSRFHTVKDFATMGRAYFTDQYPVEAKAIKRNITKHDNIYDLLNTLGERFATLDDFSTEQIEATARQMADELEVKPGVLINGARTVVTGQLAGPGIFDVLAVIGQDRVVQRLKNARQLVESSK